MIHEKTNSTRSVRGVFIIDANDIIQAIYFYPMSVGRNTDELLRMITALEATSSDRMMTPVNWKAGNDLLIPIPPKTDATGSPSVPDGYYSPAWYLWYKKASQ
jgi:peroxiredoxin (alkyl hydroperoxide reductase subunit C)